MALEYISTRELSDSSSKQKGKLRILKMREEDEAQVELMCPKCGSNEKRKEKWAEPFTTGEGAKQKFNVKCNKCDFSVKLLKLKKEVKKK